MAKRYGLSWILVLFYVVVAVSAANAQWVKDGIPVGSADNNQDNVRLVPDGAGGAMIAWRDYRSGETDIYANRVGANGYAFGGPGGVPLCMASGEQELYGAVADGNGSAIVVWVDYRSGNQQIFAQKIDTTGTIHWTADGINVCLFALYPNEPTVIPDGAGGAIITWTDYRSGLADIYAQRIDGSGTVLWSDAGRPVCTNASEQYSPKIAPDRSGGAIIVWQDSYMGSSLYAQRIDGAGTALWDTAGVAVCTASGYFYDVQICTNAGGEPYIAWTDQRSGYEDVYVQYLDLTGAPVWQVDGISVCDDVGSYNSKSYSRIVPDGLGGAIVAWWGYDENEGVYNVYGQHIEWDGAREWGSMGKILVPAYSYEGPFSMISDGSGGAILGVDLYPGEGAELDIYAQKVDINGNLLWGTRGAPVSIAESYQYAVKVIHDGFGGLIFAWEDYRPDDMYSDIYCQRIGASGLWGNPEPGILACADVPADQGGWVRIRTRASALDAAGEDTPIFGYNVWRLIEGAGPLALATGGMGAAALDPAKTLALLGDPATAVGVRVSGPQAAALGLPEGDWESVGFWFATRDTVYSIAVPTKNDSTELGTAEETYIVTAHTSTAGVFVASAPAVGWSVDNLAPGMTPGFAGSEIASPAGLMLTWEPNAASDVWKYNIYRSDDEFFVPGEANLLGTTTDRELHDGTWVWALQYFYKLVAVDRHGNMGPPALLRPEDVKVGTMLASYAASLGQAGISVTWTLAELDGAAKLIVLRSTGGSFEELPGVTIERENLTFTIVDRRVEPGTTYRYRVDVIEASGSRTLFMTEEISTPAMPLALYQNHPNPFNPSTTISYYLPEASVVTLEIYDSAGRLVARLHDGARQEKGMHEAAWRGVDTNGRTASSGVYFYRLMIGKESISKKMVLLR